MPRVGFSIFILGVVMVSATAAQVQVDMTLPTVTTPSEDVENTTAESNFTSEAPPSSSSIDFTMSMNSINPRIKVKDNVTTDEDLIGNITTSKPTSTVSTTKNRDGNKKVSHSDNTGIVILIIIIVVAVGVGVICYLTRRRGRRLSVDFPSRPDEANVPLSAVDADIAGDSSNQNGLQTFTAVETTEKESQEGKANNESDAEDNGERAEGEKSADDHNAESAALGPSGSGSEEKPKEPTPSAPVEPDMEEKTDDEGIVSNKTSVESLKEVNENNSNSVTPGKDSESTNSFGKISLDSPM